MIRKTNQFGFSWSESRPYKAPNGSKWLQIWFLSPGSHFVASAENLATTNATHILHSDQNHSGSSFIFVFSSSEMPWSCAKMGLKKCGCFKIHGMYMGERGNKIRSNDLMRTRFLRSCQVRYTRGKLMNRTRQNHGTWHSTGCGFASTNTMVHNAVVHLYITQVA